MVQILIFDLLARVGEWLNRGGRSKGSNWIIMLNIQKLSNNTRSSATIVTREESSRRLLNYGNVKKRSENSLLSHSIVRPAQSKHLEFKLQAATQLVGFASGYSLECHLTRRDNHKYLIELSCTRKGGRWVGQATSKRIPIKWWEMTFRWWWWSCFIESLKIYWIRPEHHFVNTSNIFDI